MNILFHGYEFPPEGGGVGRYRWNMARALCGAGHNVVVLTGRSTEYPEAEDTAAGRIYRIIDGHEIGATRARDVVLDFVREHKVDVIEGADHLGDSAPLLAVRDRPPIVIKVHGCQVVDVLRNSHVHYAWQHLSIRAALWRSRAQLALERKSIEQADALLFPSQRLFDEVRNQGLRCPARCAVLPNPLEPVPEMHVAEAPQPTLLFVGRIDIGKGIGFLPAMFHAVRQRYPGAVLELAGADSYARGLGSLQHWLQRRFGSDAGHVRFLGALSPDSLDRAYQRAWVVVVPSRWDTFPTVVLEAMARGKAIVGSPHGGIPEMLEGTDEGIADPSTPAFTDTVLHFLDDAGLRLRAGEAGRARALRAYAPDFIARKYVETMNTLL